MSQSKFSRLQLSISGLFACLSIVGVSMIGGCADTATPPPVASTEAPAPMATNSAMTSSTKININTAPIAELDKLELPGTKPSLSERIQGARPFKEIDDLVTKKAISADELALIKNLITLGDDAMTKPSSSAGKININTAPIAELDKLELPGTKPSLSERIQAARPYSDSEDMVKKKAISKEELDLIKNLVTTEK